MSITISLSASNAGKTGVDFSAYLADYDKNFVKSGYGQFSGANYSGEQYAFTDGKDGGQGVVLGAGETDWAYSMVTHTVTGSLDSVTFGNSVALDSASETFSVVKAVAISGLDVKDSDTAAGLLSAISDSDLSGLIALLKSDDLVLKGSSGGDTFFGYGHDDTLRGNGGNDVLAGGGGADLINGGTGNDRLTGGAGADVLVGGHGNDTFIFSGKSGRDTIHDFDAGAAKTDKIVLDDAYFDSFADVRAAAKQVDDDVAIRFDGGRILLEDVTLAELHRNDFQFA